MKIPLHICVISLLSTMPLLSVAETTAWKIVPNKSKITFTGVQNNAPVSGQFKQFEGNIHFDPNNLNDSKVDMTVDMNSVHTSYGAIANALKAKDWFNVKAFPKAQFVADKITKIDDKNYQADGKLTIKDISTPISIKFKLDEYNQQNAKVEGKTTLSRTKFGVGQGEWSDTNEVKDNVDVKFDFVLNSAK